MSYPSTRREFLKRSTAFGAGLWIVGSGSSVLGKQANEKLNIAGIGVGGRGAGDLEGVQSENIVALCDVDEGHLGTAADKYVGAKKFNDFRKMLDEIEGQIDAVVVATPDHCHAVAAAAALHRGKHVYCEKPLTHSIHESRVLRQLAAEKKVATQMGNQGHSNEGARRVVELIRAGTIGPVKEVHAWTDRPIWPQGIERPKETPEVPNRLHWNLWLGPAPERPYNPAYHPFNWRGWWDFGTGALGDMACHVLDPAYWASTCATPTRSRPRESPTCPRPAPSGRSSGTPSPSAATEPR